MPINVTAIFDIGKTNKKLFLFDEKAQVVYEKMEVLPETVDDDGFACEDIELLEKWLKKEFKVALYDQRFNIKKLNFSAYGASLVHLNAKGERITPLYNYLKPISTNIAKYLHHQYDGKTLFSAITASPPMGMLNSGLQFIWLKMEKPLLFDQIKCSLHLPQYVSYLFTNRSCNELTSIGCHTALWNFRESGFHPWLQEENIAHLLPPIAPYTKTTALQVHGHTITCGIGLHDSSSALVPYLKNNKAPFMLLSTGTWHIALNPFNKEPLTVKELNNDCLSYLSYRGDPVKASRLFLGNEHDYQVKRLNKKFGTTANYFKEVGFDTSLIDGKISTFVPSTMETVKGFLKKDEEAWKLDNFTSFEEAYHQLMLGLVDFQLKSINLAKGNTNPATLFVDGGFAKNDLFIAMLTNKLKNINVVPSNTPNASALGAYLLINGN